MDWELQQTLIRLRKNNMLKDKIKQSIGTKRTSMFNPTPNSSVDINALEERMLRKLTLQLVAIVKSEHVKVKGDKGDKGDKGNPGGRGPRGIMGPGGDDGYTPVKGKDYFDGKDFVGSNEELVTKINSSKTKIKATQIENLQEFARNRGGKGGSGGGMGNWIHETFNVSSATSTVTLRSKIAAGGMAHILRYQGQVQDYSSHYTITGKTVSLLFTPDDGTIISIAYVRA